MTDARDMVRFFPADAPIRGDVTFSDYRRVCCQLCRSRLQHIQCASVEHAGAELSKVTLGDTALQRIAADQCPMCGSGV